ncbi:LacI family DNA-binding transcriptional regulator [Calycomorphotria hydatis]|uniref:LacI family DNA-binding transcriptional regulator n=1 Tax=Calycomorphotria hydatis TaxID=2528027 RepID=UPI001E2C4303|nr:LacI family DNA-binding transcriptional regulator [Calycomorphotria hydatis]
MRNSRSHVTLQDVADAAGVSVSTASRSLNGLAEEYRIRESTAELVRESAKRLGFQPSLVARSLRLKKTGLVGMVVPDLSNPFFSAIAREVTVSAESEGFSTLLADSGDSVEKERTLIEQLVARKVESLVVCPVGVEFDHLKRVHQQGMPLVTVDRCSASSNLVQVTSDHLSGARQAIDFLVEHGHRRIGILQGLPGSLPCELRLQGARESLAHVGVEWDSELVAGDEFTLESGYRSACKLLKDSPEVTALFAMSTPNAFGAFRAAMEFGRSVPNDLSIIAFDDAPFAEFMEVPVTVVAQDIKKLGRTAAGLVIEQVKSNQAIENKTHKIPVELIARSSVGRVNS